jgi:hypothetical protein
MPMTIDHLEFQFCAALARNELLKRQGTAFQDFFVEVAHHRWAPDFEGRRPQGSVGDKKCDGYRPSNETVFQCYAPRKMSPRPLCSKIKEDYFGALRHGRTTPIRRWTLVHNDHEQLPTEAHELILKLRRRVTCVSIDVMGPEHLLHVIMELPRDRLMLLFPHGLSAKDLRSISYRDIDELIASLGALEPENAGDRPEPPSSEKIAYNDFSEHVAAILRSGFLVQRKFFDYFANTSRSTVGNRLAQKFKKLYAARATEGDDADQIFWALTDAVGGLNAERARRAAIIGLIAYMFHSCDIFENPPKQAVV